MGKLFSKTPKVSQTKFEETFDSNLLRFQKSNNYCIKQGPKYIYIWYLLGSVLMVYTKRYKVIKEFILFEHQIFEVYEHSIRDLIAVVGIGYTYLFDRQSLSILWKFKNTFKSWTFHGNKHQLSEHSLITYYSATLYFLSLSNFEGTKYEHINLFPIRVLKKCKEKYLWACGFSEGIQFFTLEGQKPRFLKNFEQLGMNVNALCEPRKNTFYLSLTGKSSHFVGVFKRKHGGLIKLLSQRIQTEQFPSQIYKFQSSLRVILIRCFYTLLIFDTEKEKFSVLYTNKEHRISNLLIKEYRKKKKVKLFATTPTRPLIIDLMLL